ncbi:hypothetical protein [Hugenholtzia roseola]|uniref:hypothetical protein n=1 Tax=Hugenholtzia roseola TaxID=1002 RepID=UPI00040F2DB5|nr:hypothetical protein [Hugenholtzia roseola]
MKKIFLTLAILTFVFSSKAQTVIETPSVEEKPAYSLLWGLFQSNNYSKIRTATLQTEKTDVKVSSTTNDTETEQKSLLWGAIQWTEKKKNASTEKTDKHGK